MDFTDKMQIEQDLVSLPVQIKQESDKTNELRAEWLTAKAMYENKLAEITLMYKAKQPDMTQADLKAQSTLGSHNHRLTMILAESKYRQSLNQLNHLKDLFEVAKERSYTYRSEVKQGL